MTPACRFPARRIAGAVATVVALIASPAASAADQTQPGAGIAQAMQLAHQSPLVQSAMSFLKAQARQIKDPALRTATLDILTNPDSCAMHRRGLGTQAAQDAVIQTLFEQGFINRADAAGVASGVRAAIFPPVLQAESDCPRPPQPLESAPGSSYGGHHSYPGGLPVHEANNDRSGVNLASQYQATYGHVGHSGLPEVAASADAAQHAAHHGAEDHAKPAAKHGQDLPIDADVTLAAPIWHDWAKTIVFQWNADGSEFKEFDFGGTGTLDAWGKAGDSRTGGHHILSVAEAMARGFAPLMVIAQASAHSAPTLGNEYKVVNWLRAAAIIARLDPVKTGYLSTDAAGNLRLPALGKLGEVDLNASGQTNLRVEYVLHNLSDADYTFSGPAVSDVNVLLTKLATEFGYDAADTARYNTKLRNPALAYLSGERLLTLYSVNGLDAVRQELKALRAKGVI